MTTRVDPIRTFILVSLALGACACAAPTSATEDVATEDVAEDEAGLSADSKWPPTCVTIHRGGLGDAEDATVYEISPYYNEGATPRMGTGNTGYTKRALVKFDLSVIPPDAPVLWAHLGLTQQWTSVESQIHIHEVVEPWSEGTVTWESFAEAYDPELVGVFFTVSGATSRLVKISSLVSRWVRGVSPNHGVLLAEVGPDYHMFASSEHPDVTQRPYLRVCYAGAAPPESAR